MNRKLNELIDETTPKKAGVRFVLEELSVRIDRDRVQVLDLEAESLGIESVELVKQALEQYGMTAINAYLEAQREEEPR